MENKYLTLIVEVYESVQPITELTIKIKRNEFLENLSVTQKQFEERDLITKKDFLNNCETAVIQLKNHIVNHIQLIRNKKVDPSILAIKFGLVDKFLVKYGDVDLNRKKEIESKILVVNKLYGKDYLVNINSLVKSATNEMRLIDIEFIESFFEKNRLIEYKQGEVQDLDLFNSSTVEVIKFAKHVDIFSNNGFELFEYILENCIREKSVRGRYDDLSYYYRCLFADKYIHQRPEPFRLWFIEIYDDEFSKIKTIEQTANTGRKKCYSSALEYFSNINN